MTKDHLDDLLPTLERLVALPEDVPVIVVDNGSADGTAAHVRARFPQVRVVELPTNVGVAARNLGVRLADTPYVAFNDDDSWWAPGSLAHVVELFDAHERLGAVTAHIVVEPGGRDDPTSQIMADSPLTGDPDVPGVPVLGFLACATAVRRAAFLQVGGFEERLHFFGEEDVLAIDLATAGWQVRYVQELRIHHHPGADRPTAWRARRGLRNQLWTLWLRRPASVAARHTWASLRTARVRDAVPAALEATARGSWVPRARRVVPHDLEADLARLDAVRAEAA